MKDPRDEIQDALQHQDFLERIDAMRGYDAAEKRLLDRLEAAEKAWKISDQTVYDLTEKVIPNIQEKLEAAESEVVEQARLNGVGGERELALMARVEAAERKVGLLERLLDAKRKDHAVIQEQNSILRAEIDNIKEVQFDLKVKAVAEGWRAKCERIEKEREALRAKIAEMEKQEPVAWWGRGPRDGRIELNVHKPAPSVMRDFAVTPLYALPGAKGE